MLVSFEIKNNPITYYQAELLIYSLKRNGGIYPADIFVQCPDTIDVHFIQYLASQGVNNITIHENSEDLSSAKIYQNLKDSLPNKNIPECIIVGNISTYICKDIRECIQANLTVADPSSQNSVYYSNDQPFPVLPFTLHDGAESFEAHNDSIFLHYDGYLTSFGLLKVDLTSNSFQERILRNVNREIAQAEKWVYFETYKKNLLCPVNYSSKTAKIEQFLAKKLKSKSKKYKLILHVGSLKTGTTSLQFFFDRNNKAIHQQGVYYPRLYLKGVPDPKHQWLVSSLKTVDDETWIKYFDKVINGTKKHTHTIFLSTEGLYNHWFDFSDEAKSFLSVLTNFFDVEFWVFFRKPYSFMYSLYKQCVQNPCVPGVACYARDWSFTEMLNDEWFFKHLDYLGYIGEYENTIGSNNVKIFEYTGNTVEEVCQELRLSIITGSIPKENISLSDSSIALLRQINRFAASVEKRQLCLDYLEKINTIVPMREDSPTTESQDIVEQAISPSLPILREKYQLFV